MRLSHRFPTMGRVIVVFPQFLFNLDWLKEIGNDDCVAAETLFWQCNTLSGACGGSQCSLFIFYCVKRLSNLREPVMLKAELVATQNVPAVSHWYPVKGERGAFMVVWRPVGLSGRQIRGAAIWQWCYSYQTHFSVRVIYNVGTW